MGGTGWYRHVTITEKEGGVERRTNLTLPSYLWLCGETGKWPNAAEGETLAACLCLFGMRDPPPKKFFLGCVSLMKHGGSTLGGSVAEAAQGGGGGIHWVGGYEAPQSVCHATASWV